MSENKQTELYCEKCDKWLDNSQDYTKKGTDDVGTQYQCKNCGNLVDKFFVSGHSACGVCFKKLGQEKPNKPNWNSRQVINHQFNEEGKVIKINHPCSVKCNAYQGCGKEFIYQSGNEALFNLLETGSYHRYCPSCFVKVENNLNSSEDKEKVKQLTSKISLDTNQIKSNQIKSNQIKSNQIKSNQSISSDKPKTNYLPWILGGIGLLALIAGLWYFTRNKEIRE